MRLAGERQRRRARQWSAQLSNKPIEKSLAVGARTNAKRDPSGDTSSLGDDSLELFHTIRSAEDVVGSIYLESDLRQMHDRRWRYINIAAGVFVFALFVTWLIASRLQRMMLTLAAPPRSPSW